jgi:hypothetical protein
MDRGQKIHWRRSVFFQSFGFSNRKWIEAEFGFTVDTHLWTPVLGVTGQLADSTQHGRLTKMLGRKRAAKISDCGGQETAGIGFASWLPHS